MDCFVAVAPRHDEARVDSISNGSVESLARQADRSSKTAIIAGLRASHESRNDK
jgi:hypothetical protein